MPDSAVSTVAIGSCMLQVIYYVLLVSSDDRRITVSMCCIDGYVKGCYAISVSGELPEDVLDTLRDKGIVYQSRDRT